MSPCMHSVSASAQFEFLHLVFSDGSTGYTAWCYTVPTSMSSPHATRTVLFPFVGNKPMMKVLSKFECLNCRRSPVRFPNPIGRPAHRRKAFDAYSMMSSLDPVSIEFWAGRAPVARGGSIACSFPLIRGIVQLRDSGTPPTRGYSDEEYRTRTVPVYRQTTHWHSHGKGCPKRATASPAPKKRPSLA